MKQFIESSDFLNTVVEETEKNSSEATRLTQGLSETQLNWTSSPERWSMAQCLDHLAVASHGFDQYFAPAIERGREKWPVSEAVPYRPTWMGSWLIRTVAPENKKTWPAPKVFRPSTTNIAGSLEKFLKQQEVFLGYVRATSGVDYNRVRLRSPVTPLMRYSLADAFVVTVVHGQRHLNQARRMMETPGFPA